MLTVRSVGLFLLGTAVLLSAGCGGVGEPEAEPPAVVEAEPVSITPQQRRRLRPPVNTTRNLYEGSLWRGAASWGNLLRDHRARYRGDLLTVSELGAIFKVAETKPEKQAPNQLTNQPQEAAAPDANGPDVDPILAFLRQQEKVRELIDREQNEILRSIESIEVEVVRVLSNGNLLVRGVHPPIFRDRNRVKYVISISGIVRPSDVTDTNNVAATKLSKADYKVKRLVRRTSLAPAAGTGNSAAGQNGSGGGLADRMANFFTGGSSGRPSRR